MPRKTVEQKQAELVESYGSAQRSNAIGRNYVELEPSITVRDSFGQEDFDAFRKRTSSKKQKHDILSSMLAYDDVGVVRNIVDLMADFACQGLTIVHKNKSTEKFYKSWFKKIGGKNITERFLNYLYRHSNVIMNRTMAKIKRAEEKEFKRAAGEDYSEEFKILRREIPWSYDFLCPILIDIKKDSGQKEYWINMGGSVFNKTNIDNTYLPQYIKDQVKNGSKKVKLDENSLCIYHYKKDDWLDWATPMMKPILKDIAMLDRMKLADNAALDGAISNVRLWTIGSLEYKIPPSPAVINRLRDIIASNTGGGVFDLVWGPELTFKESATEIYKFLGNEKYIPVLNNIYMGFGISAAIAGGSNTNGGYANNFVSIKTLIERLEYGREVVQSFWDHEFEIVQKAMKFDSPAQIHFDSIILSDEAAIKNLLINLVDRNIMSEETLLERFREIPEIEKVRLKREASARERNPDAPQKASPFHNPQGKDELARMALNTGNLDPEYLKKKKIPFRETPESKPVDNIGNPTPKKPKKQPRPEGGRPKNSLDTVNRKRRRVVPRSRAIDSTSLLWAMDAQEKISSIVTPVFLEMAQKKNVRSLSSEDFYNLENIKLSVFLNAQKGQSIDEEFVQKSLSRNLEPSQDFIEEFDASVEDFISTNNRRPNVDEIRNIHAIIYCKLI
jgi:hypothetical protein